MSDLVCVGSLNVDLVTYVPAFPLPGETVAGTSFQQGAGGKGANQAAAAARLCGAGERVRMVGAVGDDALGRDYLDPTGVFAGSGVDCAGVATIRGVSTGVAPIFVNAAGENCIVVVPGANGRVDAALVDAALRGGGGGAAVGGVLVQLEVPQAATLAALRAAAALRAPAFFTPAPAPPAGLADDAFFALTSVLIPNEGEARALLPGGDAALPLADVAARLAARGARAVVVTRGAAGALVVCPPHAPVAVPAPTVRAVVDTTGAGDCFSGSLAFFYARLAPPAEAGAPDAAVAVDFDALVEAARRAVVVAAHSVARKGAQSSYAARAELPAALFNYAARPAALPTEV